MAADGIAVRADLADALITARRAKMWLFVVLMIVLLGQLAIFFTARRLLPAPASPGIATTMPTTQPIDPLKLEKLRYFVAFSDFAGLGAVIVLLVILFLMVNTMFVGRLLGVSDVTSAFVWCIVLLVLIFPWQALLSNPAINVAQASSQGDFKIPGILYTWAELTHPTIGAKFSTSNGPVAFLRWSRYVGFPIVAVILLLIVQVRSSKGLRKAMGGDIAPEPALPPTTEPT